MRPAGPNVELGDRSPARCLGERCKLLQQGLGRKPEAKRFCSILTAMDDLW